MNIIEFNNTTEYKMDCVPMTGATVMLTNGELGKVIHLEEIFKEQDGMTDCYHALTIESESGHIITIIH